MTHHRIDECSVPMRVRAVEYVFGDDCEWTPVTVDPRDERLTSLHRYLPCRDPAGAPSGLQWVGWQPTGREVRRWELTGGRRRLGWCLRHWASRTWRAVLLADCGTGETVHEGALSDCARELVREVRRG